VEASQYIDIHTHKRRSGAISMLNLFPEESDLIIEDNFFSIGLHPWEVTNVDIDIQLNLVKDSAKKSNVLAIGEIGLDKYKPDFELQTAIFLKQINIAKAAQKPIIVHCVKAYSELFKLLKDTEFDFPVIIHRYSGNITIAEQLIKSSCYFSFGHELFNEGSKTSKVFKKIPISKIFLETDDSDVAIQEVYAKASEIKQMNIYEMITAVRSNFNDCFDLQLG